MEQIRFHMLVCGWKPKERVTIDATNAWQDAFHDWEVNWGS